MARIGDGGYADATEACDTDVDVMLREGLESQMREAAERATFHRVEAERWERTGRAAAAGIRAITDPSPVAAVTVEGLMGDAQGGAQRLPFQHADREDLASVHSSPVRHSGEPRLTG